MAGERTPGPAGANPSVGNLNDGTAARTLSSLPGAIGVKFPNPFKPYALDWALEGMAKFNFSVQLCKDLVDHYCNKNGALFVLTEAQMKDCNAVIDFGDEEKSVQFLGFVDQIGREIMEKANGDPVRLKKDKLESDVSFEMFGACNTSGTLGNFIVNGNGKLVVWDPMPDPRDPPKTPRDGKLPRVDPDWSFEGYMWWDDVWDFDRKPAGVRTETGESRTTAGRMLSGTAFKIKSVHVPVKQARGDASGVNAKNHFAKWSGNPKGELPPVVSGIY